MKILLALIIALLGTICYVFAYHTFDRTLSIYGYVIGSLLFAICVIILTEKD